MARLCPISVQSRWKDLANRVTSRLLRAFGALHPTVGGAAIVDGMTIKVVAVTNNTYGHHGEMALPSFARRVLS